MISATSTPNIAFIKYWGNRHNDWRLPAADSLSMTLDSPSVTIELEPTEEFAVQSFNEDGSEKELSEAAADRFKVHWNLCNQYLDSIALPTLPEFKVTVRSQIPAGIGLASSAAVFSAAAKAYSQAGTDLTAEQISILARLGSGSASRSVFDGFSALENHDDSIGGASSRQIAPKDHWLLHDIVIVPSQEHKKVGSTEGHALAHTSPHFKDRIEAIEGGRQAECIQAILDKDFLKLQMLAELDSLEMHEQVMQQSTPPLNYLSEITYRLIDDIKKFREKNHLPVLFTMDAGPTVHLVCTGEAKDQVTDFAKSQADCQLFETKIGN